MKWDSALIGKWGDYLLALPGGNGYPVLYIALL